MANLNAGTRMFYTRPSDGATYCFEPVPLLAESKQFSRTIDSRLGTVNTLTFNGTLLPSRPALSGVDPAASCLELLDRKSDQLTSALSEDFGDLLIIDASGYPVVVTKPRVISIDFEESQIVTQRKYTVVFEFETDFDDNAKVTEFTESWNFSQQEDDTVSVSHDISAIGISEPGLSITAITNARTFVLTKIGLDKTQAALLQTPTVQAMVDVDNLSAFNHVLSETSDITAGSYQAQETWILTSGNFKDDRTIEHSFDLNEEDLLIETISINGTVQGYGDTTFDKFTNALNGFDNTVVGQINFNATSGIAGKSKTENRFTGTISYSITTAPSGDDIESRSISRSIDMQEDGSVIQTVTTAATIRAGSPATIQTAINYAVANNFPVNSTIPIFDVALSGNLQSSSAQRDETQKSYSLTRIFVDQSTALWTETYEVNREQQLDTSEIVITINGTVQGFGVETGTKSEVRFVNASGAFFTTVEPSITARVTEIIPTGSCISTSPTSDSFGFNRFTGTITYSQSFANRFLTDNVNVLKEEIEVSYKLAGEIVAEISIPGKASGPILQDQETVTGLEKSLTISFTMNEPTNSCDGGVSGSNTIIDIALVESNILIDNKPSENDRGEKPESSTVFKISDTFSFNRQSNVFQRNVTWKYL